MSQQAILQSVNSAGIANPICPETLADSWEQELIERSIELALEEDLGPHNEDLTSEATIPDDLMASASLVIKEPCILAGLSVFSRVFTKIDSDIKISTFNNNGDAITSFPHKALVINGKAKSILKGERIALNYIQRLSGIATVTRRFVDLAKPYGIQILNTRKTTPGLRALERYATSAAGAVNHRFGLSDGILIKDNHIRLAGGVKKAVGLAFAKFPTRVVEVETTSISEVLEAKESGAEIVMLDNMTPQMVAEAVKLLNGHAFIEVSGGINIHNIRDYLIPGVNGISAGCLTHSAPSIDISLEVET